MLVFFNISFWHYFKTYSSSVQPIKSVFFPNEKKIIFENFRNPIFLRDFEITYTLILNNNNNNSLSMIALFGNHI